MFAAVHTLACVIPNLGQLLFPVLDIGYDLQKNWGDVNLKKVSKGPDSMFPYREGCFLYIDRGTKTGS